MQKVVLAATNAKTGTQIGRTVKCTPDHRWILKDGSVTTNLKVNDILFKHKDDQNNWYVESIIPTNEEYEAWCVEEPTTHSFTLAGGIVTGNCDLINLDDMLQNGTVISGKMIETPKSFRTACTITTQIVAQVASNQYGGQTFNLAHLLPFVEVSRKKIRKHVEKELEGLDVPEERIKEIVESRVYEEIKSGIQVIQYQLITLMTTNGQAPFVSIQMWLNEVPEEKKPDYALMISEVLKQRMQGVKNEKGVWITPEFPKLLYILDEDNVHDDSPYFYLTELAAKCTAKRMVPDYISAKMMRELKNGDVYSCMGCRSFLTVDRCRKNLGRSKNYVEGKSQYWGRFNQGRQLCPVSA